MHWIADRFFTAGQEWLDAATGQVVRVRLSPAGDDDMDWSEECSTLSTLRHPLLNPLVDYGMAVSGRRFEAYERGEPVHAGPPGLFGESLLQHLTEFLRASGISVPPERASAALRPIVTGRVMLRRPIGLRLQARPALEAVEESFETYSPPGWSIVDVCGSTNAGLRTFRTLVARAARIRGLVPLDPATIRRHPRVLDALKDRHVCLLDDLDEPRRSAACVSWLVSILSLASARHHVLVRFGRRGGRGVALDPLSVRVLLRMVHTGSENDPDEQELIAAARASEGLPGVFVSRLCGAYSIASRPMVVHETSPVYGADVPPVLPPRPITGRVLGAALRAQHRASALAATGRHAAGVRVLDRGIRVLRGRDRLPHAAECAMDLGSLWLDRGNTVRARDAFEMARQLAGATPPGIMATIGIAAALTDERRSTEAEAALRGALAAADIVDDLDARLAAAAALARCLLWQERFEEAVAVATTRRALATNGSAHGVRLLATLARAQVRLGRVAAGVRNARGAQQLATGTDPRAQASAELALAESLDAAGDLEGRRAALTRAGRLARANHLPLVRIRALIVGCAGSDGQASRVLRRLERLRLPPLLAHRVQRALAPPSIRHEPVVELETLLTLSQRAPDDAGAVTQVCKAVIDRTRAATVVVFGPDERTIALHGRGWANVPSSVKLVLTHGSAIRPDGMREPQEYVEPVRFGGEVIGAVACRWTAGAAVDIDNAAAVLRAASLSIAPHVRAIIDRPAVPPSGVWNDLLGDSAAAATLRERINRAARAPFPVLVEGESGSGKELVARAIHRLSVRRERRFCALNCAALTDDLVESELFGHARGAFTGAATERAGLFEEADGGTLFLDEVGELSARAQAKLLRVLQEGEVRRVGENFPRHVDVRVVAATNRRLEEEASAGRFRTDLRFRLDVIRIAVPPLRDRATDIPLLAAHFWQDASARMGSRATLSPDALAALARYDWPGNVRELQNVIAWMAVQSPRRGRIGPSGLPRHVAQATFPVPCSFEAAREEFERRFIRAALAGANGQRARAAAALGITRQGLAKMIKRLGIEAGERPVASRG